MSYESRLLEDIDRQRESLGFRGVADMLELTEQGNTVLDPFSTLISKTVSLGSGNVIYPNVILQTENEGKLKVGDKNVFYPNTLVLADKGEVGIGDENQFGDGGCSIKANMPDAKIAIGDRGRYINGALIIGKTTLGSGSQVLGPITVQNCNLEAGGDFRSDDVDERAGLLKGAGLARGLEVLKGHVINGDGTLQQEGMELQSAYH